MDGIIEFNEVTFGYSGTPVLKDATFTIDRNDFVSIIGPNGGGKTTLAKLILGILTPQKGKITVFGRKPEISRYRIGYVPQFSSFDPNFPVSAEEVALMGTMKKTKFFFTGKDREKASLALEEVGLADAAKKGFSELSGGQRQRVLIARALISDPEILLMDEPTASVDVSVEERISTLLKKLSKKMTVILITHDMGFVSDLVSKIICVNQTVNIHPADSLTQDHINHLYSDNIRIVRHDIKEK